MARAPRIAVFRPDDERLASAVETLESRGATAIPDPLLSVEPTGNVPTAATDMIVLTSKSGVECLTAEGWTPQTATVACIGPTTADRAQEAGWDVDIVPAEYSSAGLVTALDDAVAGKDVTVARSDHGSTTLIDGLEAAGASVSEIVLYRLTQPAGTGQSTVMAAGNQLDAACFSSSLTIKHFINTAERRGVRSEAIAGLNRAIVGAIGNPTCKAAEKYGIRVDVVPESADFEQLIDLVLNAGP